MDPKHYQGGAPPGSYQAGAYGGPPPAGQYGGPPPAGQYGGPPPAGQYGGQPPAGQYGGQPPAGQYGAPPPPGQHYPYGQGPSPAQGQPPNYANPGANYGATYPTSPGGEKVNPDMPPEGQAAAMPSAPSLSQMDNVTGYEHVGFSDSCLPPPSYDEATRVPPEREEIKGVYAVSEEDARDALLSYVAENCCYGKGAAESMKFTELVPTNAFHYTLESFCEGRSTSWAFEPYMGQILDTPANGPAPGPWDLTPSPGPTMFQNKQANLEVPHTASVKPCHNCCASGWIQCNKCYGRGRSHCTSCHGRGHTRTHMHGEWENRPCTWCHGHGTRMCHTCHGHGRVTCTLCNGRTQVKCYIKLTINWVNHMNDHIVERTELPNHLIRDVTGQVAFNEASARVFAVNHFPDQEINNASRTIVDSHAGAFPTERMLMQRHQVRIVPVTRALYNWKGDNSDFFVYGFENKIYAPKYPQTCCCGCTIL